MMNTQIELEQYLLSLISIINATQQFQLTKKAIIVTTLSQTKFDLPFIEHPVKKCLKFKCTPELNYVSEQLNTSIINTHNYFFQMASNPYPCQSAINFLYLLTFYTRTSVLLLFKQEQFQNQHKQQTIKVFNDLGKLLGKSDESKQFWRHFIFGVYGQKQNNNNYYNIIKKNILGQVDNNISKQILEGVLSKQRIINLNNVQLAQKLILQILAIDQGYDSSPHILTKLCCHVLSQNQIQLLKEKVVERQNSPPNNYRKIVQNLSEAIQNRQIFLQDNKERSRALYEQFFSLSPLSNLAEKAKKLFPQKKVKIPQQYAIQAAFFILMQIYKTENQFSEHYSAQEYFKYNQISHSVWDRQLPNKSIMAELLDNFFSIHTILYDHQMLVLAKYLQVYFLLFQNVPALKIREKQLDIFAILQNDIIQKLVTFFYENLDYRINNQLLLANIQPIQLLRLTAFVKKLISLLQQMTNKQRTPFQSLAEDFKSKAIYIASIYFFIAWKCYQKFSKFWNIKQSNHFMVQLYKLCRNKDYFQALQNHPQKKPNNIIKRLNQYFGKFNYERKQYYLASKFYQAALLNCKLIQIYESWLQRIYVTNQLNYNDIKRGIKKLADLGLVEKARIWCYKFMEIIENNSQIVSILEDLVEDFKHDNKNMMEEINKMKENKICIVDDDIIDEVQKQLQFQDWLPLFEDY